MKIFVIGGANVDISGKAEANLKLKDSNPGKISFSFGGVARNIAENLARLGQKVVFVSAFSDDLLSLTMLKHLSILKVDVSNCLIVKNATPSAYLALLNKDNDMEVAVSDTSVLSKINPKYLKPIIAKIKTDDILVIDTNLSGESLKFIFNNCKGKIFVDPISTTKAKKIKPYFNKIYSIKPNIFESEELTNYKINKNKDVVLAANKLSSLGVNKTFISLGKMGSYGLVEGKGIFVRTGQISIKSATGAGDAYMAGLVVAETRKLNLLETLRYATGCSLIALASDKTVSDKINNQSVKRLMRGLKYEN
jgi:pseudouridine kinase